MCTHNHRAHRGRIRFLIAAVLSGLMVTVSLGCDGGNEAGNMMGGDMMGDGQMMGDGMMMGGDMPEWMMSHEGMMGENMMRDMRVIHRLLANHEQIERTVEDIPGGVRTETTSPNPELAQFIRTHVRQMKERVEEGQPIRRMDPVFREIFEHGDEIDMEIEDIEGGVRVVETSDNPQVTLLIRQHAKRAVSEFVDEGMQRAMEPTPLPEGYRTEDAGSAGGSR